MILILQFSPQEGWWAEEAQSQRSGVLQQRVSIGFDTQNWEGDGVALGGASTSLCGSGQKHAFVCTAVSVCECVNVFECVSQCLVYEHNALLFSGALPTRSSSTSVTTLQPLPSIQLSNTFSLFWLWLTCSFMRAYSFLLPSSFLFTLFIGFIEVLKCSKLVLMQPFVYCLGIENMVHSLSCDYCIKLNISIHHTG